MSRSRAIGLEGTHRSTEDADREELHGDAEIRSTDFKQQRLLKNIFLSQIQTHGTDITLRSGRRFGLTKSVPAHKFVLSANSSVLDNLTDDWRCRAFRVNCLSADTLLIFVRFLYTATLVCTRNVLQRNIRQLLTAASEYRLTFLKFLCEDELLRMLSEEEVEAKILQDTMQLGKRFKLPKLNSTCEKLLVKRFLDDHGILSENTVGKPTRVYIADWSTVGGECDDEIENSEESVDRDTDIENVGKQIPPRCLNCAGSFFSDLLQIRVVFEPCGHTPLCIWCAHSAFLESLPCTSCAELTSTPEVYQRRKKARVEFSEKSQGKSQQHNCNECGSMFQGEKVRIKFYACTHSPLCFKCAYTHCVVDKVRDCPDPNCGDNVSPSTSKELHTPKPKEEPL